MAKEYVEGPCTVCTLLDQNEEKKEVAWCNMCRAHICKECESNWIKRGKAFLKKVTT